MGYKKKWKRIFLYIYTIKLEKEKKSSVCKCCVQKSSREMIMFSPGQGTSATTTHPTIAVVVTLIQNLGRNAQLHVISQYFSFCFVHPDYF